MAKQLTEEQYKEYQHLKENEDDKASKRSQWWVWVVIAILLAIIFAFIIGVL